MIRISILLCTLCCLVLHSNYSFSQQTKVESILTIGAYDWQGCGLINSINRNGDKNIELPEDTISALIRKRIGAKNIGTGFIYEYNDKKYVVTCEHVILKAGKIRGFDSAHRAYELRLVGGDTFYDIAVLEFVNTDEAAKFKSVQLETRLPTRGSPVQSIGYWYKNQLSSFSGDVSRTQITIKDGTKDRIPKLGFIESTAKSPKGHSGGVLLNPKNKVLGMNVMRYSEKEKEQYYALESQIIKRIVEDIADYGSVKRAFTGIQFAQRMDGGYVGINKIISNSPAAQYRDQLQDKAIKSINGKPVNDIYDVLQIMENIRPGTEIKLGLDTERFTIKSEWMEREPLRQIAEHAAQYDPDVSIKGEAIILNTDEKQAFATIAGVNNIAVYCINSVEQLGILVRIFGLHRRIKIGTGHCIRKSGREIYFSKDDKMILYY